MGAVGGFLAGVGTGLATTAGAGDPGAGMANIPIGFGAALWIALLAVAGTAIGCYLALRLGRCRGPLLTTLLMAPVGLAVMATGLGLGIPGHISGITIPIFARGLAVVVTRRTRHAGADAA